MIKCFWLQLDGVAWFFNNKAGELLRTKNKKFVNLTFL